MEVVDMFALQSATTTNSQGVAKNEPGRDGRVCQAFLIRPSHPMRQSSLQAFQVDTWKIGCHAPQVKHKLGTESQKCEKWV